MCNRRWVCNTPTAFAMLRPKKMLAKDLLQGL